MDQDKIYRDSVYKNVLETLLPFIEGRELFEMDRLAWLGCVGSINSRLLPISSHEMSPEVGKQFTKLLNKLKRNRRGDGFVSSTIASKICYEMELSKIVSTGCRISILFNNPLTDFNLCDKGASRENLTSFDLEMFFDIMRCSPDLQRIIRFIYSPCSEKIVWDEI